MDTVVSQEEEKNRRRGMLASIIVHMLLLLLAILPLLTYPDPPPGQEGILVNLGLPNEGQGSENSGPAEPVEEEVVEEVEEVVEEVEESTPSEPETEKEVVRSEAPSEVDLKKKKEEEKKRQEEAEKKRKQAEAKKKAEAEKKRKQEEADRLKDQLGGLFKDGKGKGNTGKPGSQGDPDGDPNSDNLDGISKGSGNVGGGLSDRGVVRSHTPKDNSQKEGKVVVKVCVDKSGSVTEASFTQAGSTIFDSQLRQIAVNSAKRWKFKPGSVDRQCGTITYNFKVR